uniref:Uncharacterized protein n=1 Tax=Vespula pensylvanica TaxID=30213 RepID=A0A834PCJ3_VESPE|nr:hypothetical protein H0235_003822 [Vespula pensylvanica]
MEEVKGRRGEGGCQRHRDVGGGTDGASEGVKQPEATNSPAANCLQRTGQPFEHFSSGIVSRHFIYVYLFTVSSSKKDQRMERDRTKRANNIFFRNINCTIERVGGEDDKELPIALQIKRGVWEKWFEVTPRHASGDVGGALRGEKRRSLEMSLHEYIDIPLEVSLSLLFPGSSRVSARLSWRMRRSGREDETRPMLPRWLGLVKWRCSGAFEFCPRIDNDNDEDDDEDDDDIGGLTGST